MTVSSDFSTRALNKAERDKLIMKYAPLVKHIVGRIAYKLPIDASNRDDLINVGIIGLMEALDKYDQRRNVQFETYARFRIRGAILDELRSRDWVPRSVRNKDNKLEKAFHALKKALGRQPDEYEVAEYLGITIDQYYKLLDETKGIAVISQEDLNPDIMESRSSSEVPGMVDHTNPLDLLSGKELQHKLKQVINELPQKEKIVISLYYYDEMTMKEIGCVLGLTESRVCQLHTQATLRLRSVVKDLKN
ncbi:MAG: FliA/WhiG family RNA polymerase sigma factor [Deltaproteobacteria bacterium]|nr:FliA/WhiG family RNA polymerase sigma factor [Deltaproteobacteria bacterium]